MAPLVRPMPHSRHGHTFHSSESVSFVTVNAHAAVTELSVVAGILFADVGDGGIVVVVVAGDAIGSSFFIFFLIPRPLHSEGE